jgi:hypothetical protein
VGVALPKPPEKQPEEKQQGRKEPANEPLGVKFGVQDHQSVAPPTVPAMEIHPASPANKIKIEDELHRDTRSGGVTSVDPPPPVSRQDPAVTISIRNPNPHAIELNAPEVAPADTVAPATSSASASTLVAEPNMVVEPNRSSASTPVVPAEKPRGAITVSPGVVSAAEPMQAPVLSTATYQNTPIQSELVKAVESRQLQNEPPRPVTAPEPMPPEKASSLPVKSLALEFTPDGARDVRVRLSERAGEVHVSLHSSDPVMTRNLRDGVTDLASVLAHAGYDARAWTSGRQQQESRHQQEEKTPARRNETSSEAENFEGMLQES